MQTVLPARAEVEPMGHAVQADAPGGEYVPAGQIEYVALEDPINVLK